MDYAGESVKRRTYTGFCEKVEALSRHSIVLESGRCRRSADVRIRLRKVRGKQQDTEQGAHSGFGENMS